MKKFFSLIAAVLFAGSMMATTVSKTVEELATAKSWENATVVTPFNFDEVITVSTAASDANTGKYYSNGQQVRLYQTGNATVTLTAAEGYTISSITLTYASQNNGILVEAESGVAVPFENVQSATFTVGNSGDATNGQVRITAIEVTYDGEGGEIIPVTNYYLVGSAIGWAANEDYKLAANPAQDGEYMIRYTAAEGEGLKVLGVQDENQTWYQDGEGNEYIVEAAGEYDIYFRPEGNAEWPYNYFILVAVEPLADPTNCAEAAEAALSVSANNELYNDGAVYTIEGYVTSIQTAYSDQYHNITFWMADEPNGGNVLEAYRAACASEADAPVVGDKVAVTGSLTKYNTTPEFAAGCTFVITEHAAPVPDYYLVGSVIGWEANEAYKLAANPAQAGEYMIRYTAAEGEGLKVLGVLGEAQTWYPDGEGNEYIVEAAGEYNIYFRPEGNSEWPYNYFILVAAEPVEGPTNCAEAAEAAMSVSQNNELYNNGAVYTIEGYVTSIQTAYSDQYHNITFWMADAVDGGNVLEAYRAACASLDEAPNVGDKVAVTGSLTKYNTTPEFAAGCTFVIIERGEPVIIELDTINIARAMEIGMALADNATTDEEYVVAGWVVMAYAPNEGYTDQTWFMADEQGAYGEFEAYRCTPDYLVEIDQFVYVKGRIKKYVKDEKVQIEIGNGTATHMWGQGIDNTNVEVQATKVIENGKLVIIKNGVRYDAQGARL